MTSERVAVLAVTKMLSGMCTGGISLASGQWVRPVKEFGTLLLGDLTYRDHKVIRPFDIVKFGLVKPRPRPPHCEDWVCDFVRARPELAGRIEDLPGFLEKHSDPDAPGQILRAEKSLALFEPSQVEAVFRMDGYSGKYEARLRMPEMGDRLVPVTDIKLRALGKKLLGNRESLVLRSADLRQRLGADKIFVALGLGRMYEGRHWPLVIGVHICPDYEIEINYKAL